MEGCQHWQAASAGGGGTSVHCTLWVNPVGLQLGHGVPALQQHVREQ